VILLITGLINATNLTLADQQISGILGLGFPRLSILARSLLAPPTMTSSSASANASALSSVQYLPLFMESIMSGSKLPYPVFGLALTPPSLNTTATLTSATSPAPSTSSRYDSRAGSLTLGGVSSLYVSDDINSGRTVHDIEWWDVVPFGMPLAMVNATRQPSNTSASASTSSSPTTSALTNLKRQDYPSSTEELASEQYLHWALTLRNVSINGTDLSRQPTYQGFNSIVLIDAGSNGIYGPQQDVERIFGMIEDARQVENGLWAVPCSTRMTIGFSFG
jgi:hypothetical protein